MLRVDGGMVASDITMQWLADLIDAPVDRPVVLETTALGAASRRGGFEYGRVRGTGSAAFILGTLVSGQAIGAFGLEIIIPLQALLLCGAGLAAIRVPELPHPRTVHSHPGAHVLFRLTAFRNLVLVAALVMGLGVLFILVGYALWALAGRKVATVVEPRATTPADAGLKA